MAFWKPTKYKAVRVDYGGYSFASGLERAVYQFLKLQEVAKEIVVEKVQDKVLLSDAAIEYRPDFRVRSIATGEVYWVEAKGMETPEWRLKRRLWISYGPGNLVIYSGKKTKFFVKETLVSKKLEEDVK